MFLNSLFDGITGFLERGVEGALQGGRWVGRRVVEHAVSGRRRPREAGSRQPGCPRGRLLFSDATDRLYKVTFPAGSFLALPYNFKAEINGHAYESHRRLVEDVVAIEKRMIADVVAAGCRYVQLDFPVYPFLCDPDWKARMEKHGYAWKETLELAQWADREVIAGLPDHVRTGLHVCRGNNQSAPRRGGRARSGRRGRSSRFPYDSFLIEWEDKARTGDYTALRHVPPGDSVVVLGIVSSKHPALEKQDDLLRELDRASAYLEPGRLAISPQCGFASTLKGNLVTEDDQWRKLELVASTARRYWS